METYLSKLQQELDDAIEVSLHGLAETLSFATGLDKSKCREAIVITNDEVDYKATFQYMLDNFKLSNNKRELIQQSLDELDEIISGQ